MALETREGYTLATLQPTEPLPLKLWAKSCWEPAGPLPRGFPTLTRPCAVKTPRLNTPGVDRASAYALGQWRKDMHRRLPLHYERAVEMVRPRTGDRRRKTIGEYERLHFFPTDYTYQCMGGRIARRIQPSGITPEAACPGTASAPPSSLC